MSAESVGDYGVLLTRDKEGVLRGFENACRHRGHELLPCGASEQARAIVCPYHAWSYRFDGSLIGAPGHQGVELRQVDARPEAGRRPRVARLDVHRPHRTRRRLRGAHRRARGRRGEVRRRRPRHPRLPRVRRGGQLEGGHRELPGVLPLRDDPPRAVQGEPAGERREHRAATATGSAAGWTCATSAQTMSLDGRSGGIAIARLDEHEKRTVMYVAVLPNLLISLHPDYVMTHLLTPLTPDRTRIRCSWAFPAEVANAEGFDPAYAVDFWDLTNRQDWAACESVQRGHEGAALRAGSAGARRGRRLPLRHLRGARLPGVGCTGGLIAGRCPHGLLPQRRRRPAEAAHPAPRPRRATSTARS